MKTRKDRIVFYSKNDMTVGYELNKIQELLTDISKNDDFDINDFLEFYSIKQYFDNELFSESWSKELKKEYIDLSNELFKKTAQFLNININNTNIIEILKEIEFHYTELFYYLFDKFNIYRKIDWSIFIQILDKKPYFIEYLLKYKNIVIYYEEEIKSFLQSYEKSTELFLYKLEGDKLYFPESLSNEEKEEIVLRYLKQNGKENINKVEHISKLRSNDFLKISDKTKLLAKKNYKEFIKDFFKGNTGIKHGYTVGLSKNQEEYVLVESSNPLEPKISYSINMFNTLYESNGISYLFRNIFGYLDNRGNINLVNIKSEISVIMELFSSNTPKEYKTGPHFKFKEIFSTLNIITFVNYLKNFHDKNISSIIEYFISNLKLYNGFDKVIFKTTSIDKIDDYADMIKIIMPGFDLLIKQFICHIKESEINFEIIGLQDGFLYKDIPSLLEKKYFYEKNDKLNSLKHYFFSDQSGLFYIKGFERKYKNFYGLISKENLKFDNFDNYQIDVLKILIKDNIIYTDEEEYIKITNKIFISLVGEIYKKGVLSYYGYNISIKKEILEMENLGYLYSESTLLSHLESSYFNYYLNDSEFSNSYGIRNKNMHGYYYGDENKAYNDFMIIIKLIVLIFLKIEDELYIINKY